MKASIEELKSFFPEIDLQIQATIKGGDGTGVATFGYAFPTYGYNSQPQWEYTNIVFSNLQNLYMQVALYEGYLSYSNITQFSVTDINFDNPQYGDDPGQGGYYDPGQGSDGDYGPDGYNAAGYDQWGYSRDGYDANGYDEGGFDRSGYNQYGYDIDGYDTTGHDADGFDMSGYNQFTGTIYDADGYDQYGYNENGFNDIGLTVDGSEYNSSGFDVNGYDAYGFNADGINESTGTAYGTDGFDQWGVNALGFDSSGFNVNTGTYYDEDGYDVSGHDENGFDATGFNEYTGTTFDAGGQDMYGADSLGFFESGINIYTGTSYGTDGLDMFGNPPADDTGNNYATDPSETKYFVQPDNESGNHYDDSDDGVSGDSSDNEDDDAPITKLDQDGNKIYSYDKGETWLRWGADHQEQISGDGGQHFTNVGTFIQEIKVNGSAAAQRAAAIDVAIEYVKVTSPLEDDGYNMYSFGGAPQNVGDPTDCSHYISYLIKSVGGIDPALYSADVDPATGLTSGVYNIEQALQPPIGLDDVQVGDLVTFRSTGTKKNGDDVWPYHIGMVSFIERDANGNPTIIHYTDSAGGNGPEFNSFSVSKGGPYTNTQVNGYYRWTH